MNTGIRHYGRLLLLAVMLIAGTLRAAPVLACAVLDTELRGPCCCTDEGPTPCRTLEQNDGPASQDYHCDCCKVSFEPTDDADAAALSGGFEIEKSAAAPPPKQPSLARAHQSFKPFPPPAAHPSGGKTYLLTARLRL